VDVNSSLAAAVAAVRPIDATASADAIALQALLTKPRGALGLLEDVGVQLAGISGSVPPPVPVAPAIAVFAGDHGVARSGVTPWPQEVTAQMVANFCAGGAAISVLARQHGARLVIVDVGVASALEPHPMLWHRRVRAGTADLADGPAMTMDEALAALDVGVEVAAELIDAGADLLVTGEMGIGNTTSSAALIGALCEAEASAVTGRGTGIDDEMLERKTCVVEGALGRIVPGSSALDVLAEVGGLEIAALAGFVIGASSRRVPVVIDGVIALAATCVAAALAPAVLDACIAGHRSSEPGASVALAHLGLRPLIDLGLRLGEGSGACLALPIVRSAALIMNEMATFDGAGVNSRKDTALT
jgi:nicotinate-nucleotide--dimethylbenzimidazole phosphoribosyltransferase